MNPLRNLKIGQKFTRLALPGLAMVLPLATRLVRAECDQRAAAVADASTLRLDPAPQSDHLGILRTETMPGMTVANV